MKIVIDARMISWTGIGRYTSRLIEHLQQIDKENEYVILLLKKDYDLFVPTSPNFSRLLANYHPYSLSGLLLFGRFLKKLDADLVHFTSQNTPLFFPKRAISTVHDLTLIDYKNVRGNWLLYELKYSLFKLMIRGTVVRSRHIITPSTFVKEQLMERYQIQEDKLTVTPEAADLLTAKPADISRFKIEAPFIFYLGNAYPYKNLARLTEAFAAVHQKLPQYKLVLGGKKDYFYSQLEKKAERLGLTEQVIFTGYLNDGELVALYKEADLFVFPSLSEGFGLPALEAMQYGVPVLAARATSLPETVGEAGEYFDPTNVQRMADSIIRLLDDRNKRKALSEAGVKHVKNFSWRKMTEETLKVYLTCIKKRV